MVWYSLSYFLFHDDQSQSLCDLEIPVRKDGSQPSILSEAPLKSIRGSPLPNILYTTSISSTWTFFYWDILQIEEYGRELGYAIADEYTYLYFPQIDSFTIIQFLESWCKRFQSYQHRFDKDNNRHTFSLNHDININFSVVLKIILQRLIEPVTKSQVIFGELRPSSISFSFEVWWLIDIIFYRQFMWLVKVWLFVGQTGLVWDDVNRSFILHCKFHFLKWWRNFWQS